jgi:hypothetical protein
LDPDRVELADWTKLLHPRSRLLSRWLVRQHRESHRISAGCFSDRADRNAHADTGGESNAHPRSESNANADRAANAFTDTDSHAGVVAFTHPDTCANRYGHTNVDPNPGLR